jgi:hypothetical protein
VGIIVVGKHKTMLLVAALAFKHNIPYILELFYNIECLKNFISQFKFFIAF